MVATILWASVLEEVDEKVLVKLFGTSTELLLKLSDEANAPGTVLRVAVDVPAVVERIPNIGDEGSILEVPKIVVVTT